jgi:hypothetical protein
MFIIYLRILGIPVAIIGWLVFQLIVRKRTWKEIQGDAQAAAFMIAVWIIVYLVLLR